MIPLPFDIDSDIKVNVSNEALWKLYVLAVAIIITAVIAQKIS